MDGSRGSTLSADRRGQHGPPPSPPCRRAAAASGRAAAAAAGALSAAVSPLHGCLPTVIISSAAAAAAAAGGGASGSDRRSPDPRDQRTRLEEPGRRRPADVDADRRSVKGVRRRVGPCRPLAVTAGRQHSTTPYSLPAAAAAATSCRGTDSQRPHRCRHPANNFGTRRISPYTLQ